MEGQLNQQEEKEVLDKDCFMECMRSIVRKMNQQERMIKLLVDDMNMRNHEGILYLRGERMYSTQELIDKLHICRRSITNYRKDGELAYILLRNKAYHRESDVIRFIQENSDKVDKRWAEEFLTETSKNGDTIANR
ncbi:MAG: helix-turn-helix domain-containing protein [Prevotella sp.]|nr:helix-turn-helix domain-containing protein [Prevotella sp.]